MERVRTKVITVASIFTFDAVCLIVFGGVLGWI
jgi:hypothetical protein